MGELIHGELSYKIVGLLFGVYNKLGSGLQEIHYQRAVKSSLAKESIPFLEHPRVEIVFDGKVVGSYYLDFLIDNKIVLEIKAKEVFNRSDIQQVLGYLRKTGLELGLLAKFGQDGVKVRRLLRGYNL